MRAAVLAGLLVLAGSARAGTPPTFVTHPCEIPSMGDLAPRLTCGTVAVPRDPDRPEGATFRLAVFVVASEQRPARGDPVVYISGGPGSPLTRFAAFQARHPYAPGRDLILVDQRGTEASEPDVCRSRQAELLARLLAVAADPTPAALAASRDAHLLCRADMVGRGIDPETFATAITAEDFERVRQALGARRWNVVGESYGTEVALTLLARHPGSIRSAVLDSLDPPDPFLGPPWSARAEAALDEFLTACGRDPACTQGHPAPLALYRAALERFRRDPVALDVPRWAGAVRLTASLLEEVVVRLLYYPPTRATLPAVLEAAAAGDVRPLQAGLAGLLDGARRDGNEGAFTAVECRDRPSWREPATYRGTLDLALLPPSLCESWSAVRPPPAPPVATEVPTLILAFSFDPNIRPAQSRAVAERLGVRATWVEVAGAGHSVRRFSACAERLVAEFIAAPDDRLDTSCAAATPEGKRGAAE